jgi:hypothetical protein
MRLTYEIFAGAWGAIPAMRTNPIGAAPNSRPKYVAATAPEEALDGHR